MRLKNPKAKGSKLERAAAKILLSENCTQALKSGGSFGAFDLIGLVTHYDGSWHEHWTERVRLVQVKANRCSAKERKALEAYREAELWIKPDRHPWVRYGRRDGRWITL